MKNLLVTTYPFGANDKSPLELLDTLKNKYNIIFNNKKRKYTSDELHDLLREKNPEIIIAGTEHYGEAEMDICSDLKMISRVGIGVDNIDFDQMLLCGVVVANTPDAPSNAVAELTILQMLNMLRKVQNVSNIEKWNRYIGRELKNCIVGIIGYGRIGRLVSAKLSTWGCSIFRNDILKAYSARMVDINKIIEECDIITLHIPLKDSKIDNTNFIRRRELNRMKPNVRLLNMSRGGIINEDDMIEHLKENPKCAIAVDVFNNEPLTGELTKLKNAYLTPHLGSCTVQSRKDMEYGSVANVIDYIGGKIDFGVPE